MAELVNVFESSEAIEDAPSTLDGNAVRAILKKMIARSRTSAAKRALEHSLPDQHASVLYKTQGGRCDVTGLPFSMQSFPDAFVKHPFAPSLDRRDSQRGYVIDNVRLVYASVNFGMGQWGQEVYLHCARAAVEHDRSLEVTLTAPVSSLVGKAEAAEPVTEVDQWHAGMRDRISAAETIAMGLTGNDLSRQRRHIASLKRNLNLGPKGLTLAAIRAAATRENGRS